MPVDDSGIASKSSRLRNQLLDELEKLGSFG